MIYSHVKADGRIVPIQTEKPLTLEEMQKLVGGWIEFTPDPTTLAGSICVNEEGRINGMPRNSKYPHLFGDVVLGRMVAGKDGDIFVGIL